MSQLVKLKGALPAHMLRGQTSIASNMIMGHQTQTQTQRSHALARAPAHHALTVRPLATAARAHAATPAPAAAATTAAAASPSASSSSASSSSRPSSSILFGLLAAAGGATLLVASSEIAHAEADQTLALASPPQISLDAPAPSKSARKSTSSDAKRRKKKRGERKPLDYPGKLGKVHQAAEGVVNVHVGQGLRTQFQLGAYAPDPLADKAVTLIPMFELGGPSGPVAQLVASTQLGRKHAFEGYADSMGNGTGHYKGTFENGLVVKPSWQLTANGNMYSVEVDWKGREQVATLSAALSGEATFSYNQSLSPQLIGGVELHYALMSFAHVNGGLKYTTQDKAEQFALSKKDGKYTASYWRLLKSEPHFLSALGFPDQTIQFGAETSYSTTSEKSDLAVGVKYARQTYNYQVALTTATPAVQFSYDSELIAGAPNLRWGLSGQINYDGSGESVFGLNMIVNM